MVLKVSSGWFHIYLKIRMCCFYFTFSSIILGVVLQVVRCGFNKHVTILFQLRVDMNSKTKIGQTPLHLACEKAHFNSVQLLVESGMGFGSTVFSKTCILSTLRYLTIRIIDNYNHVFFLLFSSCSRMTCYMFYCNLYIILKHEGLVTCFTVGI